MKSPLQWVKGKERDLPTKDEALIRKLLEDPAMTFGGPWLEWLKARLELEPPQFVGGDLNIEEGITIEHDEVVVGKEPALSFDDSSSIVWTVTDDPGLRVNVNAAIAIVNPGDVVIDPALAPYINFQNGNASFANQAGGVSQSGSTKIPSFNGNAGVDIGPVKANIEAGFALEFFLYQFDVGATGYAFANGRLEYSEGTAVGRYAEQGIAGYDNPLYSAVTGSGLNFNRGWKRLTNATLLAAGMADADVAYEDNAVIWLTGNAWSAGNPMNFGPGVLYWSWVYDENPVDNQFDANITDGTSEGQVAIWRNAYAAYTGEYAKNEQIASDAAIDLHKIVAAPVSKTTTYTATTTDDMILADATSGAFTITMPDSPSNGQIIWIVKTDSSANAVTIAPGAGDAIDNLNGPKVLRKQREMIGLIFDTTTAYWKHIIPNRRYTTPAAKTTTYTALESDDYIFCDATSGAFAVNLMAASGMNGKRLIIKKIDASANAVTVTDNATDLIDGAGTYVLGSQWESVVIVCNGTTWYVESAYAGTPL